MCVFHRAYNQVVHPEVQSNKHVLLELLTIHKRRHQIYMYACICIYFYIHM
jgi:hypothetical protein